MLFLNYGFDLKWTLPRAQLLLVKNWSDVSRGEMLLAITGLPRVREKSGKNKILSRSGNFEKMSGNFGHLTNVREMSGNFVMTINFFWKMIGIFLIAYIFKS